MGLHELLVEFLDAFCYESETEGDTVALLLASSWFDIVQLAQIFNHIFGLFVNPPRFPRCLGVLKELSRFFTFGIVLASVFPFSVRRVVRGRSRSGPYTGNLLLYRCPGGLALIGMVSSWSFVFVTRDGQFSGDEFRVFGRMIAVLVAVSVIVDIVWTDCS